MPISDKTIKLIWGKSGNRCALCKTILSISPTDKGSHSVVGDICHIIASSPNGPRYDSNYPEDQIDGYDNLILLCKTHHKQIDDQPLTHAPDHLRKVKHDHEQWVEAKLRPNDIPKYKIKQIRDNIPEFNIVIGAHSHSFDNDELLSKNEVELVANFFQIVSDWAVIGNELEPNEIVRVSYELTQMIKDLDSAGFWVFGASERQILEVDGDKGSPWNMAILNIKRKESKNIIKVPFDDKGPNTP
jgi:hypothetical protein